MIARAGLACLLVLAAAPVAAASPVYDRLCLPCHGAAGDGQGPAAPWLDPKPRDLTRGVYKWRSTPSGRPPTDIDLARTIRAGAPGTSMPGFAGILDESQIGALVAELKALAPARFARPATPVDVLPRPTTPLDGRTAYRESGCSSCHGDGGRGDGPSATALDPPPFDLTVQPLRRGERPEEIYLTLATGLDGTAMPSYPSGTPEERARIWALVDEVERLRTRASTDLLGAVAVSPRVAKATVVAGLDLRPQGDPPATLPPAAASLSSAQCGRCHARQLREWQPTIHAHAFSPGLAGQLVGAHPGMTEDCLRCHAPLAEQRTDEALASEGVTCSACHVRGFVRHGPPRREGSGLLTLPSYPFVADAAYERSDFCMPCHQLGPNLAVNGRPLLNTYREWLEGPYMRRGVQCQHCHMPDREHTWRGVHDLEAVREGLRIRTRTEPGVVEVSAENVGAGHFLPTTSTPAIWIAVGGQTLRIGRHLAWDGGWREREDTRIPPGGTRTFRVTVPAGPAHVRVTVAPDEYYERFYQQLLAGRLPVESKRELEAALVRAQGSRFVLHDETVVVPPPTASPRPSP